MAYLLIIGLGIVFISFAVPWLGENQRRQQEMWERQLEDERMAEIVAEWERRYRVERWS